MEKDTLKNRLYIEQVKLWPAEGEHILANFDEKSISVYQAYRPEIANFAVEKQRFGGEFKFSRMSWIKPNFLWMMYRSGWATKEGQERVLEIRIARSFFDEILGAAVASSFDEKLYRDYEAWRSALVASEVRLQWDPDHDPHGESLKRRAVQLGLRGSMLKRFAEDEIISITDITEFVAEQRKNVSQPDKLLTPYETVYLPGLL